MTGWRVFRKGNDLGGRRLSRAALVQKNLCLQAYLVSRRAIFCRRGIFSSRSVACKLEQFIRLVRRYFIHARESKNKNSYFVVFNKLSNLVPFFDLRNF